MLWHERDVRRLFAVLEGCSKRVTAVTGDQLLRWPSPAKLNLFLHIIGRRTDGYHLLQTVFQLLDFGDEIAVGVRDDGQLKVEDGIVDLPEQDNLVWRAAQLLRETHVSGPCRPD